MANWYWWPSVTNIWHGWLIKLIDNWREESFWEIIDNWYNWQLAINKYQHLTVKIDIGDILHGWLTRGGTFQKQLTTNINWYNWQLAWVTKYAIDIINWTVGNLKIRFVKLYIYCCSYCVYCVCIFLYDSKYFILFITIWNDWHWHLTVTPDIY